MTLNLRLSFAVLPSPHPASKSTTHPANGKPASVVCVRCEIALRSPTLLTP